MANTQQAPANGTPAQAAPVDPNAPPPANRVTIGEGGYGAAVNASGTRMTIVCDLTAYRGESSTGKSRFLATTRGNKRYTLPGGRTIVLSLNAYEPIAEAAGEMAVG